MMTGTVTSSGRGGTAAAMAQIEQTAVRAFHARAAATGKARSPSVVLRVYGWPASTLKHSEDADMNLRRQSGGGLSEVQQRRAVKATIRENT